ncbi:MAG TPA: hypothetical protein VM011_01355 [Gammaproteobacteria bacterium]|nr:hypothetical protein [Gammaproteobacteria bacterium]
MQTLKRLDPDYAEWMAAINNEVSEAPAVIRPFRQARADLRILDKRKANKLSP